MWILVVVILERNTEKNRWVQIKNAVKSLPYNSNLKLYFNSPLDI